MRFLKIKIARAREANPDAFLDKESEKTQKIISRYRSSRSRYLTTVPQGKKKMLSRHQYINLSNKNVAKNYGRAICCFVSSELSDPYIKGLEARWPLNKEEFKSFIDDKKDLLNSMDSFKELLLVKEED